MQLMTSMAMMNNMGDNGSPCRKPRAYQIFLPGLPFICTLVEAVDKSTVIYLAMSTFSSKVGRWQL